MKIRSKIDNLVKSINGYYLVTLQVPKIAVNDLFKLKDDDLDVEIKKHREKRSLDANNYMWALCTRLAEKIGSPTLPKDVYKHALRECNIWSKEFFADEDLYNYLKEQEDEEGATFRVVDKLYESESGIKVRAYKGSRKFDSYQMSRLIDYIVEECKEQGIDTMPPDELERLVSGWHPK